MTISVIQATSASSAFTASFASGVTAGNSVFIVVTSLDSNSGTTITSSSPTLGGSSVTGSAKLFEIQSGYNSGAGFSVYATAWLLPDCPGGATAVALTVTNGETNSFIGTFIYEVAGLGASPIVDQLSTGQNSASTAVSSGTTGTILYAPEIVFGGICTGGGLTAGPAGYTNQLTASNVSSAGYQIVSSSGGAYSYAGTSGSGSDCFAAGIVTVAPAGSVVPGPPLNQGLLPNFPALITSNAGWRGAGRSR